MVIGMIFKEMVDKVIVIENSLVKIKFIVLVIVEIEVCMKVEKSIMFEGLVNKFICEEIFDLVVYVFFGGKKDDKLFQGGYEHYHNYQWCVIFDFSLLSCKW